MKIVVCLIVYGDHKTFEYRFKTFFNDPRVNYIIHYNKRDYSQFEMLKKNKLFQQNNIFLFSEIKVFWGDISILDAELKCIEKANDFYGDYDNLIILDGKSLPCRSWDYIINKIDTFDGNWMNLNHEKYNKNSYYSKWFEKQKFYSELVYNLEKSDDSKTGEWWLPKTARKNFKYNIEREIKKENFTKWLFMYINHYLFFSIKNQRHLKVFKYYIKDMKVEESLDFNFLNIIGPNIILSKKALTQMSFEKNENEYNRLKNKASPEEMYFSLMYCKNIANYKSELSKNAFSCNTDLFKFFKRSMIKTIKNNEDLLFLRRYDTIEKMKWFKKNFFSDNN